MKMIKIFNSILSFTLLLISISFAFGQTTDEGKLELAIQTGHSTPIISVAYSPNGKIIASGSTDGLIKLWEAESGQELKSFTADSEIFSLKFSPNGKILASGEFNVINLWDIESNKKLITLHGHTDYIWSLTFSSNGKILASGSGDNTIKLWDVTNGKELRTFIGHTKLVSSVMFSPDGKTLASRSNDETLKLWEVETGKILKNYTGFANVPGMVVFSRDGKTLVAGLDNNTIKLWDIESGNVIKTFTGHSAFVFSVVFSPDGKTLASASRDETVKLWDTTSAKELKTLKEQFNVFNSVIFSPDGKTLTSVNNKNDINLWDVSDGKELKSLQSHSSRIFSISFSPDGKILAFGNFDGSIKFWNVENGKEFKIFTVYSDPIRSLAYSPDGETLALGSYDGTIKLLDTTNGKELETFTGHSDIIKSVTFSPDGTILASGSNDNTIKLWDVKKGEELKTLTGHSGWVESVTFSPDGKTIATGSQDSTVKIWNAISGKELRTFVSQNNVNIKSVAFSSDGKTLTTESFYTIKVWDIESGKEIKSFDKEAPLTKQEIAKLFPQLFNNYYHGSVSNRYVAEIVDSNKIKLFERKTYKELVTLVALDENDWVVIDPEGRFDGSEGALKLMHYTYGLEIINLDQLKEVYYEPGLLQKLLGYSKEPLRPIVPLKDVKLYPEVVEQSVAPDSTKLTIKLKNRGGGIGAVQVFVGNEFGNKLVVEDARDEKLKQNPNVPEATLTVDLQGTGYLKGKPNKITVVNSNYLKEFGRGNIQSRGTEIVWLAGGKAEEYQLPTLYAIVGGVSDYAGSNLKLRFAAKDAEDFSNALSLGAKKLFCDKTKPNCIDKVNITTLSTSGKDGTILPTKENFIKTFREVASKAKPEDIVVIYLAGHGVSFGGGTDSYFYLTQEARTSSNQELQKVFKTTAISNEELTDWLTPNTIDPNDIFIKAGQKVLILDTCAAGNFAADGDWKKDRDLSGDQIRAIDFLKGKTGTFILMGSSANKPSYEATKYNQGLLTYALLEGMKGAALQAANNYIDVRTLFDYAEKRVPALAKDVNENMEQRPIIKQPSGNTFPIGQMTDTEKTQINLPQPKPLMLRPSLGVLPINNDPLNLIAELRKRFDAESSYEVVRQRGDKEPQLIYIDDNKFPGGIQVTGTYTIEGENVRVKVYLVKDEKVLVELPEIIGTKEEIVGKMLVEIRNRIGGN